MQLIIDSFPLFLQGLANTFKLALTTLLFSTIVAVIFGLMSISRFRLVRWIARSLVEFVRAIPLVVNLLFVYFGAPLVGVPLDPFAAATIGLTSWGAANGAEIVRGGFNAVSKHQRESAMALGLRGWEIMVYVLAPQVLLPIIPPFTGLFSVLVQATSLASLIGTLEFLRTAQIVVERTTLMTGFSPAFLVYGFVLIVYFIICFSLAGATRVLERYLIERTSRRGLKVQKLAQQAAEGI
ncbi:MAG: amino acid ABC transporter permease [Rhizobiales bacterium]|nr:amino acid ABC transporter permease [Hyphomicrobiales bacterium]